MTISVNLWANWQAAVASFFMVRAMWLSWRSCRSIDGPHSTGAILSLLLALHGAMSGLFFTALAFMAWLGKWHVPLDDAFVAAAVIVTVVMSITLLGTKSAIVWLGERRGSTHFWRLYVAGSVAWAALAAIF